MSVLEAMARGIPTVATAVGGVPQVIEEGVSGYLVGVDDFEELSARLISLLGSAELRADLGHNARNQIVHKFGVERSVARIKEIYVALSRGRETGDE